MNELDPATEEHLRAHQEQHRRAYAEWLARTYPDGLYDDVEAAARYMDEDDERAEAEEQRRIVSGAQALWAQGHYVSVERLRQELGITYARAKKLHRDTQPPATLQLALRLPDPQPPQARRTKRKPRKRVLRAASPAPRIRGYVYVVRSDGVHYKIGITGNPQQRLRQLSTGSPHMLEFEILEVCEDIYRMEEKLHKRFEAQRVRLEWYTLTADDLAEIRRWLTAEHQTA